MRGMSIVRAWWAWVSLSAIAWAGAPDPLATVVDQVERALSANDEPTLKLAIRSDEPGVYLLADELCARGKHELARRLIKYARPADGKTLGTYIDQRKDAEDDKNARARLHAAFALVQTNDRSELAKIVAVIDQGAIPDGTVVGVRLHHYRAAATAAAGDLASAGEEAYQAGMGAQKLGDIQTAAYAFELAASVFDRARLYSDSIECLEQLAPIRTARGDSDGALDALNKLMRIQQFAGRADGLITTYDLLIAQHRASGNNKALCLAILRSALPHLDVGNTATALRRLEEGLKIAEDISDDEVRSQAYFSAASVYMSTRNLDRAAAYAQKALEVNRAEKDLRGQSMCHVFLATLAIRDPAYDRNEAENHFKEARQLARRASRPDAVIQANLHYATFLSSGEHHERAISMAREAADLAKSLRSPPLMVAATQALGGSLMAAKRYPEALKLIESMAPVWQAFGGRSVKIALRAMTAECQRKTGDLDSARATISGALEDAYELTQGIGAEQGAGARRNLWVVFDVAVSVAFDAKDSESLLAFQERGRAAALLESLGGSRQVQLAVVPEAERQRLDRARNQLRAAQDGLADAKRARHLKLARKRRTEVQLARDKVQSALEAVERESAQANELLRPATPKLKDVQASLRPNDTLVSYSIIGESSCALVVSRDAARIVELPVRRDVKAVLDSVDFGDRSAACDDSIKKLRAMLIEPLGLTKGAGRLIVGPNAHVAQVPFSVLVPDRPVVYVPSLAVAMQLAAMKRAAGKRILALGDPKYDGAFAPLPHTRAEAKTIGDVVLLGEEATKPGFTAALNQSPSWRAVHFACHGIVDLANPGLSGLALSDGSLRYFDILQMQIPADLVTLSACETGRGKAVHGEGVFGLTRAFLSSGARRVLVSLWPVEDKATQTLMKAFYKHWKRGETAPSAALQRAQAEVRKKKKWHHPAYWAAWQLWGTHLQDS